MGIKKIVLHWSGGVYVPNSTEFQHYHFLFNGNGDLILGLHKPEDNINCNDGNYAAHCGGGNSGAVGIALCGMLGYKSPQNVGKYPLKQVQFENAFKLTAELCKKYGLTVNPATVFTHYEFGRLNPSTSSAGKIDISFIPYLPKLSPNEIGNYIRNKVQYYYERL